MEREPDVPGGGHHRPLRKRARTTRAMESKQQERDRECGRRSRRAVREERRPVTDLRKGPRLRRLAS
ncbi:hypothetical protein EDB81DRAFT_704673 [Dactylonectria macrodidyma]|uniref:Uncharacterized protein n=1 Tax=Dactylonectria macrodidyma TaxID=307937 RepID=A0A9P9CZ35_9HYPO|nr:hypothetical protein EDB81DRAFT_704673 [Dactylonectria macrodidyma]